MILELEENMSIVPNVVEQTSRGSGHMISTLVC